MATPGLAYRQYLRVPRQIPVFSLHFHPVFHPVLWVRLLGTDASSSSSSNSSSSSTTINYFFTSGTKYPIFRAGDFPSLRPRCQSSFYSIPFHPEDSMAATYQVTKPQGSIPSCLPRSKTSMNMGMSIFQSGTQGSSQLRRRRGATLAPSWAPYHFASYLSSTLSR